MLKKLANRDFKNYVESLNKAIRIDRILLPEIMNINIICDYVDISIEFFIDKKDKNKLEFHNICEDNNFLIYFNEDNTTTYLYKKSGTYEEIKTFYEDIISGKFFDFDLSECKIDII